MTDALPVYVVDTHSLVWYFYAPRKLPPAAANAFAAVASGRARLIVPVIVLAELIWIAQKGRVNVDIDDVIRRLQASSQVEIRPLEFSRVLDLRRYRAIAEMHDRLIVAETAMQGATLITADGEITTAGLVACVW